MALSAKKVPNPTSSVLWSMGAGISYLQMAISVLRVYFTFFMKSMLLCY